MNKIATILLSTMIVLFGVLSVFTLFQAKDSNEESVIVQEMVCEQQDFPHLKPVSYINLMYLKSEYDIAIEEMNSKLEFISSISDRREWFLAYKSIVNEYENIIDPPETIYDCFSENELDLLFRVVQAEIGDEYTFDQKVNVASVILNRVKHKRFPETLLEVLSADQFATISNGRYKEVDVSENTILACEYAYSIEDTTKGCLFFDSNNKLKYEYVFNDGAHNFYTLKEESSKGKLILLEE